MTNTKKNKKINKKKTKAQRTKRNRLNKYGSNKCIYTDEAKRIIKDIKYFKKHNKKLSKKNPLDT